MLIQFLNWSRSVAPEFVNTLWRGTWQGAIFIALVWLLCRAYPRIPASTRSWLWLLACGQMLFRLGSPSALALPVLPANPALPIGQTAYAAKVTPKFLSVQKASGVATVAYQSSTAETSSPITWQMGLFWLWMSGASTLAIAFGLRCWNTRKLIQESEPVSSELIQSWVQDLSCRVGVKRPQVRQSAHATCAMLAGWSRPVIILPLDSEHQFSVAENHMAISHELIHLHRNDIWLSTIEALTLIFFFFHPLARLAIQESTTSREEVCDQEAMRISNSSAAAYARLLLTTAQAGPAITVMGSAFGYRLIHRRISMLKTSPIVTNPKARRALTSLVVLGAVCALPWCVTAQSTPQSKLKPAQKANTKKGGVKKTKAHKATLRAGITPKISHGAVNSVPPVSTGYAISAPAASAIAPAFPSAIGSAPASPTQPAVAIGISVPTQRAVAPSSSRHGLVLQKAQAAKPTAFAGMAPAVAITDPARGNLLPPVANSSTAEPTGVARDAVETSSVSIGATPIGSLPLTNVPARYQSVTVHDGLLDIDFKEVEIHDALRLMFDAAQKDYLIKSSIPHETVNLHLHRSTPDKALEMILDCVTTTVTYRIEQGVYKIQLEKH